MTFPMSNLYCKVKTQWVHITQIHCCNTSYYSILYTIFKSRHFHLKHTVCNSFRGRLPEDNWVHVHKTDSFSLCCHEAPLSCWDFLRNATCNSLHSLSCRSRPLMCKALLEEKHFDSSHKLIFGQLRLFDIPQ